MPMFYRFLIFLTIVTSLLFGLHYYIWARLIRDTGLENPWRLGLTLFLVLMAAMTPVSMLLSRILPRPVATPWMWVVYSWLGVVFLLNVLLAVTDLGRWLAVTLPLAALGKPLDPERRQFLALCSAGLVLLSGLGLTVAGFFGATAEAIQVRRVRVSLKGLPGSLRGYRIVQISDLHAGPTIGRDFFETVVSRVNDLKPDLVAITGDLVDGTLKELRDQVAPLEGFKAKDGVFFVTGNHEYYVGDIDEWLRWFSSIGIRPLRNERIAIRRGFDLAGTDDITAHGPGHGQDIPGALKGRKPGRPVILLAHQPRSFQEASSLGVDLQLSGHTHGGQIYPFNYLVALFEPYVEGLHRKGDSQIYVSRGTGYWGPPMRLGAPSEITVIELEPA